MEDGHIVYISDQVANELDFYQQGEVYENKLKFEQAAELDILEAKQGLDKSNVVK